MYVHTGTWPFKCEVCQRGFSKQTNLKNHMQLHISDKEKLPETEGRCQSNGCKQEQTQSKYQEIYIWFSLLKIKFKHDDFGKNNFGWQKRRSLAGLVLGALFDLLCNLDLNKGFKIKTQG